MHKHDQFSIINKGLKPMFPFKKSKEYSFNPMPPLIYSQTPRQTNLHSLYPLSYFCDLPIHSSLALAPTASINIVWHIPCGIPLVKFSDLFFTLHLTWPHQRLAFLNTSFVKLSSPSSWAPFLRVFFLHFLSLVYFVCPFFFYLALNMCSSRLYHQLFVNHYVYILSPWLFPFLWLQLPVISLMLILF